MFNKIYKTKLLNYSFLISVIITSFLLIKYARYREYGNDLIPLLVCYYFFIKIIDTEKLNPNINKNLLNFSFPFAVFMLVHKISFIFSSLIFLPIFNFSKFKFLKDLNYIYLLIFLIVSIALLIKNYITTTCLVYPVEFTCVKNSSFALGGVSDPIKAAWLTEIWAKGFIDNPNVRFGVNCFGSKPSISEEEQDIMNNASIYPKSKEDRKVDRLVKKYKNRQS